MTSIEATENPASEAYRRMEYLIRKHCPGLMRLPDHHNLRKRHARMTPEEQRKIRAMFDNGITSYGAAKEMGRDSRTIDYWYSKWRSK